MKKQDEQIVVEQNINAPVDKVWKAITSVDRMRKWFFENIPDFKPVVGFKTEFEVESGDRKFTHLWEVIEAIPNKVIKYTWRYKEYPGDSYVSFGIEQKTDSVTVKITVNITEDFPEDIPEFKRESCIGGWQYFIQGRLKDYLENN